ncbi:MAG: Cna B-type domain-containing protein [Anaerovoracaceae bacterium]
MKKNRMRKFIIVFVCLFVTANLMLATTASYGADTLVQDGTTTTQENPVGGNEWMEEILDSGNPTEVIETPVDEMKPDAESEVLPQEESSSGELEQPRVDPNLAEDSGLKTTEQSLAVPNAMGSLTVMYEISDAERSFIDLSPWSTLNVTLTLGDTSINGVYGDVTFKNGVANISLENTAVNSSSPPVMITGLPVGTTYKVTSNVTPPDEGKFTALNSEGNENYNGAEISGTISEAGNYSVVRLEPKIRDFMINKFWSNEEYNSETGSVDSSNRPTEITVHLLKNGKDVGTVRLNESDSMDPYVWGRSLAYVPSGNLTLKEDPVKGYAQISSSMPGWIENRYVGKTSPGTGMISISKGGRDFLAPPPMPTAALVPPMALGIFHFKIELSDKTINGQYGDLTFQDGIAECDLRFGQNVVGRDIPAGVQYTVTETNNIGWYTKSTGDVGTIEDGVVSSVMFENYRYPQMVTLKKIWNDKGKSDQRPKSVTVNLKYGGEIYTSVVLSEDNNWTTTLEGLPNESNDKKWTAEELPVDGYKDTVVKEWVFQMPPRQMPPPVYTTSQVSSSFDMSSGTQAALRSSSSIPIEAAQSPFPGIINFYVVNTPEIPAVPGAEKPGSGAIPVEDKNVSELEKIMQTDDDNRMKVKLPQTGESNAMTAALALLGISTSLLFGLRATRRRRKEHGES